MDDDPLKDLPGVGAPGLFEGSEFQIDEKRLQIQAYGAAQPVTSNDSEEGRRLNNRIEFIRIQ